MLNNSMNISEQDSGQDKEKTVPFGNIRSVFYAFPTISFMT